MVHGVADQLAGLAWGSGCGFEDLTLVIQTAQDRTIRSWESRRESRSVEIWLVQTVLRRIEGGLQNRQGVVARRLVGSIPARLAPGSPKAKPQGAPRVVSAEWTHPEKQALT